MSSPVFRFAPTPNGLLHLGHAFSAMLNARLAAKEGGRILLRIEDIDLARAEPGYEEAIFRDLAWLGIDWERPVRRQSDHLDDYRNALARLRDMGLVYPAFMTRGDVRDHVVDAEAKGAPWPRDPDGTPHYPGVERSMSSSARREAIASGKSFAWRLDMAAAIRAVAKTLDWNERGEDRDQPPRTVAADPAAWGDVVVARRDAPGSYHLAVVIDDAAQGVSDVVRGSDLFQATAVHRLLQELLGLPAPAYLHHRLVLGQDGRKLSKSRRDFGIAALRDAGLTPAKVLEMAESGAVRPD